MPRAWNLSLIETTITAHVECLKKIVKPWREYTSRNTHNKDFGKKFQFKYRWLIKHVSEFFVDFPLRFHRSPI